MFFALLAQTPVAALVAARRAIDSVQEFKMQTRGCPAEFGKLGGGVMTWR